MCFQCSSFPTTGGNQKEVNRGESTQGSPLPLQWDLDGQVCPLSPSGEASAPRRFVRWITFPSLKSRHWSSGPKTLWAGRGICHSVSYSSRNSISEFSHFLPPMMNVGRSCWIWQCLLTETPDRGFDLPCMRQGSWGQQMESVISTVSIDTCPCIASLPLPLTSKQNSGNVTLVFTILLDTWPNCTVRET